MDFEGKTLLEENHEVSVDPLTSKVYLDWPLAKLAQTGGANTSGVFVVAELGSGSTQLSRNLTYLAPTKEVHLKPAHLTIETTGANGHYSIRISSSVLARSVYLSFGSLDAQVSDNYFDLMPGETREISVTTGASPDALKAQLRVISLTDAFAASAPANAVAAQ